jgi:hypothetical protein
MFLGKCSGDNDMQNYNKKGEKNSPRQERRVRKSVIFFSAAALMLVLVGCFVDALHNRVQAERERVTSTNATPPVEEPQQNTAVPVQEILASVAEAQKLPMTNGQKRLSFHLDSSQLKKPTPPRGLSDAVQQ